MSMQLTFEEAEVIAKDLQGVWRGLTGLTEVPQLETLGDLVQRVMRKARLIATERDAAAEDAIEPITNKDLPY